MGLGVFSICHRLLGLDFPKNVQATCLGQTVSECSRGSDLNSRDLNEDEVCVHARGVRSLSQKMQNKEPNLQG